MPGLYARYMDRWERKLATRDTNRVVRPFEWGAEWLNSIGYPPIPASLNGDAAARFSDFAAHAIADSDRFFSYPAVRDYRLSGDRLTFTSPAPSGIPKNDEVHALWFPAPGVRSETKQRRALVVLPQ
jgi:hypothetical protein